LLSCCDFLDGCLAGGFFVLTTGGNAYQWGFKGKKLGWGTYSNIFFRIESAPIRPFPTNVSAGLWYTLASDPISPMSSSRTAGETVVRGRDIGGRCAITTAYSRQPIRFQIVNSPRVTHPGSTRIGRKQPPIDISPIPDVWRITLGRQIQHPLKNWLRSIGSLKEEFDDCRECL
jgi:hypothetical protein